MFHRTLDLGTRKFWRMSGRQIDTDGAEAWLQGPISDDSRVADAWLHSGAERMGGTLVEHDASAGLLADMADLDGPGFSAADLHPAVRRFYEHTAEYRLEVWSSWSPLLWPPGELISRVWGKRLEQLAVPMRPLDVAYGMASRIAPIVAADGRQLGSAWLRTLRSTGEYVFSGVYAPRRIPGRDRPSVVVSFPLEAGNIHAVLHPYADEDGALRLESPAGPFGDPGTYVVVVDGGRTFGARTPIHETFRVFVDAEGVLRTDHQVQLWNATAFRLHYRLSRTS